MQRLRGNTALWRTRRKGKVVTGWYARGRGLMEARMAGARSGRALDLVFQVGATER